MTADDFGLIKLFNFPCVVEGAPSRQYSGHCSHVAGVRFNCDDSLCISAGGHDRALFQFRTRGVAGYVPGAEVPLERPSADTGPQLKWGPLDPEGKQWGYLPADTPSLTTADARSQFAPLAADGGGGAASGYGSGLGQGGPTAAAASAAYVAHPRGGGGLPPPLPPLPESPSVRGFFAAEDSFPASPGGRFDYGGAGGGYEDPSVNLSADDSENLSAYGHPAAAAVAAAAAPHAPLYREEFERGAGAADGGAAAAAAPYRGGAIGYDPADHPADYSADTSGYSYADADGGVGGGGRGRDGGGAGSGGVPLSGRSAAVRGGEAATGIGGAAGGGGSGSFGKAPAKQELTVSDRAWLATAQFSSLFSARFLSWRCVQGSALSLNALSHLPQLHLQSCTPDPAPISTPPAPPVPPGRFCETAITATLGSRRRCCRGARRRRAATRSARRSRTPGRTRRRCRGRPGRATTSAVY